MLATFPKREESACQRHQNRNYDKDGPRKSGEVSGLPGGPLRMNFPSLLFSLAEAFPDRCSKASDLRIARHNEQKK